jgi:pimeloyl-ACP methyl ester carboxylesterase
MNETHPCDHPCAVNCADACALNGSALAPISLGEALTRFEREAVHGTCDTGRYRMPYFVWGDGPPLLFIHGVSDTGHSFLLPISRLSAHFRCVAYELPGGPGDGARLNRYTHDDLVKDAWAVLDHLGIKQSYVLGSSFGSTVALTAMRERPERIPRGILQGGLAWRPLRKTERFIARVARLLPGRMARVPLRERIIDRVHSRPFEQRPLAVWKYFIDCTGRTPIRTLGYQARWLDQVDLRSILPEVRQPVLLVCGERDPLIGRSYEETLLKGLPNAGRVMIEGCGHTPSYTHPEVLAEVVRQFLTPAPSAMCSSASTTELPGG